MDGIIASPHRGDDLLHGPGYPQTWFPVCLARDVAADTLAGIDILGTRVIVYRDGGGRAVVQSAWCPHLGADLSQGQRIEGHVRCPFHHWRFDAAGACAHIPTGDKIPPGARIFTFPAAEAWGLIWAFNGATPLFDVPRIPGATAASLAVEATLRGVRRATFALATSNGVDFQHLRTVHGLPTVAPDAISVRAYDIEYEIDTASYRHHGLITGTNTFAQHLRVGGRDMFMLFTGAPIDRDRIRSFFVVGVPPADQDDADQRAALQALRGMAERLIGEDEPIFESMRFRRGVLVASDRYLARFFKYVAAFPRAEPPDA
ncbi:Rieske 2Fe-2S domain-containing protein [Vineibacter terrae]|uniref:Rieske 2Fe-2S domain-containing protein n=1 Tax=Vineibacter terrae TaxID=2586908 RepID=A0A5C8P8G2_9HYPH|nr:Rieske 2Fe-2S domain-containing protein [Vineibacter terrae]TXL69831.1 Rieske 2Fe-2S domain-containing protein [Vineibacter terrae]